jgi:tRNA threonylcarbamoyladenosine biosynthesis protein TsaB
MAYILNIETATKNCSVAVANDGQVLSLRELATDGYAHAEKLHVFIDQALKECEIQYSDLSAVAVSKGPGSYTGLRIGVSAAKGFCMALGIPLVSIDTLQALALKTNVADGVIVPMLDARRMEVYSAVYDTKHEKIREVKAEIITGDSLSEVDGDVHIIGDCQPKIKTMLNAERFIYHDDIVYPSANEMAAVSFEKFKNEQFEDLAYFEPFYLKDFIAGGKS